MPMSIRTLFHHLFLPHHTNNQRARILHHDSMLFLLVVLFGTSFLLSTIHRSFPSVLGISINVSTDELLNLTNQKRQEAGLSALTYNSQLAQAAEMKARDMFAKNYWAHFAPDGKSPWDFIKESGYTYAYAGENLARGYTTSPSVVDAWMASPEHKANILSPNYTDEGFAVEEGALTGDSDTVLVVEMFGSKAVLNLPTIQSTLPPAAQVLPVSPSTTPSISQAQSGNLAGTSAVPLPSKHINSSNPQSIIAVIKNQPQINSGPFMRNVSIMLLGLFLLVFGLDIVLTERKKVVRLVGHSFDHMFFLGLVLVAVLVMGGGSVY